MKRKHVMAALACAACLSTSSAVSMNAMAETAPDWVTEMDAMEDNLGKVKNSDEEVLPGSDVAEQGYDFYKDAVSYNDIREGLGVVPKLDKAITIGFATKTFENEFWSDA